MKNRKMILILSIPIVIILIFLLYLHIITGGIPFIEYSYNTRYSKDYSNEKFNSINIDDDLDTVFKLIGNPIKVQEFFNEKNYNFYYYSYIKKGGKIGVTSHIYAKILVVHQERVVAIIEDILDSDKLDPKRLQW